MGELMGDPNKARDTIHEKTYEVTSNVTHCLVEDEIKFTVFRSIFIEEETEVTTFRSIFNQTWDQTWAESNITIHEIMTEL